jgi:CubicO group peptidase (beta-lactamase class C family)
MTRADSYGTPSLSPARIEAQGRSALRCRVRGLVVDQGVRRTITVEANVPSRRELLPAKGAGMSGFAASDLRARVDDILNRRPAVGLAIGVVRRGSPPLFCARGVADIPTRTPVSEDTRFRIGSITKTVTAIAVMQLWEQGLVDLDAAANDYLRAFQLVAKRPGWRPATVRHLLTHTAGIPELVRPVLALRTGWFSETYPVGQPVPTLAEFYRGRLRLVVEPGTTFTYTNHTFAALGQIVEDVTGQPLDLYVREHIFEPLAMDDSALLRSERLPARLATGYRLRSSGPTPVVERQHVTAAAGLICSTPRDMARYATALLNGGAGERGTILERDTLAVMFAPHYQPDPRVPGFGLGFYRIDLDGYPAVEHPGIIEGFNAQLSIAADDGVGVVAFTNGARHAVVWLQAETATLLGELIGAPPLGIRADVPQHPEIWGDLCGWYTPRAQRSDMQARSIAGAGVHVVVRRGQLILRSLSPLPGMFRGLVLHPDDEHDPYVFRVDLSARDLGTARVVFSRAGRATRIHTDVAPLVLERGHPH